MIVYYSLFYNIIKKITCESNTAISDLFRGLYILKFKVQLCLAVKITIIYYSKEYICSSNINKIKTYLRCVLNHIN